MGAAKTPDILASKTAPLAAMARRRRGHVTT